MKQQDLNATTRTPDAVPTELILQQLSSPFMPQLTNSMRF